MSHRSKPVVLNSRQAMKILAKVGRQMVNPDAEMVPVITGKARLTVVTYLKKAMNVVIYDKYHSACPTNRQ